MGQRDQDGIVCGWSEGCLELFSGWRVDWLLCMKEGLSGGVICVVLFRLVQEKRNVVSMGSKLCLWMVCMVPE